MFQTVPRNGPICYTNIHIVASLKPYKEYHCTKTINVVHQPVVTPCIVMVYTGSRTGSGPQGWDNSIRHKTRHPQNSCIVNRTTFTSDICLDSTGVSVCHPFPSDVSLTVEDNAHSNGRPTTIGAKKHINVVCSPANVIYGRHYRLHRKLQMLAGISLKGIKGSDLYKPRQGVVGGVRHIPHTTHVTHQTLIITTDGIIYLTLDCVCWFYTQRTISNKKREDLVWICYVQS